MKQSLATWNPEAPTVDWVSVYVPSVIMMAFESPDAKTPLEWPPGSQVVALNKEMVKGVEFELLMLND